MRYMQIFIVGTGRSGTHWIGHILDAHPDIRITIETPRIFRTATQAAIRPKRRSMLLPVLRGMYIAQTIRSKPHHYADKSHPIIWYADQVAQWFPKAKFIGLDRTPFGTVASMLKHDHVSQWQQDWKRYGIPNDFLGVTQENAADYETMNPAQRAALRWVSHSDQMKRLEAELGEKLLVINYEGMVDNYDAGLERLWSFLSLRHMPVEPHRPKSSSRDGWRTALTPSQVAEISAITGVVA